MMGQDELVLAAAEARAKATQAHESLVQAHTACDQKATAMPAIQARIVEDRETLIAALEDLGRVTGEAASRLAAAVNEAAVAVGEVADTADGVTERAPRMLAAAATDLDEAATSLGQIGPAVAQLVTGIQSTHRSTFEMLGTAEKELRAAGDRVEAAMQDPMAVLERSKPVMEELLDDALEHLETNLPAALGVMVELWEARREQTLERTADAFAAMLQHADEVTAHCAFQLGAILETERDTATTDATRITGELQSLASSLDTRRAELESALYALADRFESEQTELRAVSSQLDEVSARWATFGFGS